MNNTDYENTFMINLIEKRIPVYKKLNKNAEKYIKDVYSFFGENISPVIESNEFYEGSYSPSSEQEHYSADNMQPGQYSLYSNMQLPFHTDCNSVTGVAIKILHYISTLHNILKNRKCADDIFLNRLSYPFQYFVYKRYDVFLLENNILTNSDPADFKKIFSGIRYSEAKYMELKRSLLALLKSENVRLRSEEKEFIRTLNISVNFCTDTVNIINNDMYTQCQPMHTPYNANMAGMSSYGPKIVPPSPNIIHAGEMQPYVQNTGPVTAASPAQNITQAEEVRPYAKKTGPYTTFTIPAQNTAPVDKIQPCIQKAEPFTASSSAQSTVHTDKIQPLEYKTGFKSEQKNILSVAAAYEFTNIYVPFIFNQISDINNYYKCLKYPLNDPGYQKFSLDILAFTTYKQNMFTACPDAYSNLLPYLYNIKNRCILYDENIIIHYEQFQDYYMTLRDDLLNTIGQQIVYLSKNNSLFSAISFARSAYDCIADEIYGKVELYRHDKKPEIIGEYVFTNDTYIITDRNNSNTHGYNMEYQTNIPGTINIGYRLVKATEPSNDLLYVFKVLTGNNYHIMANLVRIITNYSTVTSYDKNAYLFLNCSERIFSLYIEFFRKIKSDEIFCINDTAELSLERTIPYLLTCQINGIGPIFVNDVKPTTAQEQIKRLRKLFAGSLITDIPKNTNPAKDMTGNYSLNNYFHYSRHKYRNNIPILINCKNPSNINYTEKYFKDRYYKNNFKSADITDEEYNTCIDKIKSLSSQDISYIFINMVSYGLYHINDKYESTDRDPDTADKDTPSVIPEEETVYSDFDITEDFFKKCCKTNEGSEIKTKDLFIAYKLFNEDVHSRTVEDTKYNKFAKDMSEIIEKTNEKKSKSRSANKTIITRKKIGSQNAYKSLTLKRTYLKMVDEILKNNAVTASAEADTKQSTDTAGNVTETDIRSTAADTNDKLTGIDILIKQINDTPPELKIITL